VVGQQPGHGVRRAQPGGLQEAAQHPARAIIHSLTVPFRFVPMRHA
jgi:hypothetical protein